MSMKRRALGRGLSSLIPSSETRPRELASAVRRVAPPGAALEIDLDSIQPNRAQPRAGFDESAILSLANSLKNNGVMQPVVVRPLPDGRYELVAGERRWRAAQRAGLLKIPAVVRDVEEHRLLEHALVENLQREDLNPIEEARAYRILVEEQGLTQQEVADRVGKQRATVANLLRLLSLAPAVQELVRSGQLSMGHARALLALPDPARQEQLGRRAVREGLSVRQVERLASRSGGKVGAARVRPLDPNVVAAENALQTALGTKVRIAWAGNGGWIQVRFHGGEELDRLYGILMRGAGREA